VEQRNSEDETTDRQTYRPITLAETEKGDKRNERRQKYRTVRYVTTRTMR
jgi:hypothetical protein